MNIEKELSDHIKSRYPILYIVSYEEARVIEAITNIAATMPQKTVWVWSVSDGLINHLHQPIVGNDEKDLCSPLKALRHINNSQENAIFIFKDLHLFLEDPFPQYVTDPLQVRRVLRDIAQSFRTSYKTLIILSPILQVPTELEKDISVFDFPLPTPPKISTILESTISEISKRFSDKVQINLSENDKDRIVKSVSGLTLSEIENVFNRAIINDLALNNEDIPFILSEKKQIIRKSGLLEYYDVQEGFENVGGLEILKDWLTTRGEAFESSAREFGLPEPRGILLLGVQGCGKSLVSKAVSALWRLPLLRLDVGSIFGKYIGESEENLRKAIKMAEALSPVVLWLDEIEKAFAGVGGGSGGDSGVGTRIFGSFITWLQEKTKPVFVISTANSIKELPPELLRKGRFDEIFFVDLPSKKEREQIFAIHIKKRKRNPEIFDMEQLTDASKGFSGAEIEQAIIDALFEAFHAKSDLNTSFVLNSIKQTVPLSVTMHEKIQELRDWASKRAKLTSEPDPEPIDTTQSSYTKGRGLFSDLDC